MATIVTRSGKGSPLTNNEVDANFTNLNSDKLESGSTAASLTITSADINGGTIDGTVIGGASAAAATFTDVTANGAINFTGATVSNGGSVTTVDINGGTIDGTVIGGSTPAAINGTTGTFSSGIYLGGTGAANYLDDYEEGTFTPTIGAAGSDPSGLSYSAQSGTYTKVGNVVHLSLRITFSFTLATGSGALRIRDLPFTAGSGTHGGGTVQQDNLSFTGFEYIEATFLPSTNQMAINKNRSGSTAAAVDILDANAGGTDIIFGAFTSFNSAPMGRTVCGQRR